MTALPDLDARSLAGLVARREASAEEVVAAHLDRIEVLNPGVNAVVGLRDRDAVLAEARDRDREAPRGPLHGLPIAVKDVTEVAGLSWTCGSPVFARRIGRHDEPFVTRLRAAGAVVVGKTNTPEFGFGSQTYNDVAGPTRNPYDPGRTIGGSSGGAAAALAARMLPLADGSDVFGSLRNPAAFGNVWGFRPTAGTVVPHGSVVQLGEIGPMARTVDDLELLLDVLAARAPGPAPDVRRVAWVGDLAGHLATEPGILDLGRAAAEVLDDLGCTVEEHVPDTDWDALWRTALVWRGWQALELDALHDRLKPEIRWELDRARELTVADIRRAVAARDRWRVQVEDLLTRYDAVLAPAAQVFPFPVEQHWPAEIAGRRMDTYHRWMETVVPWSLAGTPVLAMPAGFGPHGLPTGVQLVGRAGADRAVLRLGRAYEEATGWVSEHPPDLAGLAAAPGGELPTVS